MSGQCSECAQEHEDPSRDGPWHSVHCSQWRPATARLEWDYTTPSVQLTVTCGCGRAVTLLGESATYGHADDWLADHIFDGARCSLVTG